MRRELLSGQCSPDAQKPAFHQTKWASANPMPRSPIFSVFSRATLAESAENRVSLQDTSQTKRGRKNSLWLSQDGYYY